MKEGMPGMMRWLLCVVVVPQSVAALEINVTGTTIEQLMNIPVTTVSRQQVDLQTTPAAVFVLNRDDLRRSQVTSIPDALRLVPGVQVASIDANKWAVSIRGFNSRAANKLLVLIDGRSIYDPLFGGVFWEARNVPIEEIERIEVIRGPGGTLWGTNAVNGVINIITRRSKDTLGARAVVGVGTEERSSVNVRYGWQLGDAGHARVYLAHVDKDTAFSPNAAHDDARLLRGGFRADLPLGRAGELMLKGDAYDSTFGANAPIGGGQDSAHRGQNVVARWTTGRSGGPHSSLQFWYDHLEFDDVNLGEERHTYDLEYQYEFAERDVHRVIWGAGYRISTDNIRPGPILTLNPASRRINLSSLFAQDEISLVDRTVRLTLGAKVERNDYSGTEWQPSVRLAWVPDVNQTAWAAISRAVRSPSRLEADLEAEPMLSGNPNIAAENVIAYEVGYRSRIAREAWADAALFYNEYGDLVSIEGTDLGNLGRAATLGLELIGRWHPSPGLRLEAAYTYFHVDMWVEGSGENTRIAYLQDNDPLHQGVLQSSWTAFPSVDVQGALRYVYELRAQNVPSYLTADIGLGWRVRDHLEFAVSARNLLDDHHPEQRSASATEVERSYFAVLKWER